LLEKRKKGVQIRFQPKIAGQSFLSRRGGIEGQSELSLKTEKQGVLVKPVVTLEEMLNALLEFEREGMEKKDMGTMLFAGETEKSIGLLTLLSQRYDVVVMNPPYGDMPKSTKDYAKKHYPRTHYDYYAAFIEQAVDLCEENGFVGMLTGRTFMFLKWFEKVRTEILLREARPEIVFDLNSSPGDNILDEATGRWAATVARKFREENEETECVFVRLTLLEGEEMKIEGLEKAVSSWIAKGEEDILYPVKLRSLGKLPRMPYSYWVSESIAELFEKYPPLDRDNARKPDEARIADLKVGLQTGDDDQFTRYWWEVPAAKIADLKQGLATADDSRSTRYWWEVKPESIASSREETLKGKKWVPFVKGGEAYYSDIPRVVNWENDGEEIKKFAEETGRPRVQNEAYYFKQGLCWSNIVSSILMDFRVLPRGSIFSSDALSLFLSSDDQAFPLIGLLNSSLLAGCFLLLDPTMHHRHIGYICQLPISLSALENNEIRSLVVTMRDIKREWQTGDEVSYNFIKPWILHLIQDIEKEIPINQHPLSQHFHWSSKDIPVELRSIRGSKDKSIKSLAELCLKREILLRKMEYNLQKSIDEIVYDIYSISKQDREIIEKELNLLRRFTKEKTDYEKAIKPKISPNEHVVRLLSYYVKIIIEQDRDGIVPLEELVQRIREQIREDFGKEQWERVESEIAQMLGKTLEQWLAEDYFNFHVSLYKRRPIFWHLTSANYARRRGSKGVFNCFLHYHKLDRDTIPKIRTRQEYLKGMLDGARWRTERLGRELQAARDSGDRKKERQFQEEYEEALDEYNELQAFDKKLAEVSNPRDKPTQLDENASWVERKIAEVRDNGWNPVLDYGVRVNIEPLKEAGLLHRAAERVK
jgi:hypothetical protein